MAELDKKSERTSDAAAGGVSSEVADIEPITDTPRRSKKQDKLKSKDKQLKKNPVKVAPNPSKAGEGARLRSSR